MLRALVLISLLCAFLASTCWAAAGTYTTPEVAPELKPEARALKRKATDARNNLKAKLPAGKVAAPREMKAKTTMPKAVVLKPAPTALTTGFDLIKLNNQLLVRFHPGTPGEQFASERPFLIQLSASPPVEISPQLVTEATWPQGMNQMPLTVKSAKVGKANLVQGVAAFWACKAVKPGEKESCRKLKAEFQLSFMP